VGEVTLSNIKIYYIATKIKTVWYWQRDRHRSMEQNKDLKNRLRKCFIFYKKRAFSTNGTETIGHLWGGEKNTKPDQNLTMCTINSQWIADLM
jgi:hypothetical protein